MKKRVVRMKKGTSLSRIIHCCSTKPQKKERPRSRYTSPQNEHKASIEGFQDWVHLSYEQKRYSKPNVELLLFTGILVWQNEGVKSTIFASKYLSFMRGTKGRTLPMERKVHFNEPQQWCPGSANESWRSTSYQIKETTRHGTRASVQFNHFPHFIPCDASTTSPFQSEKLYWHQMKKGSLRYSSIIRVKKKTNG